MRPALRFACLSAASLALLLGPGPGDPVVGAVGQQSGAGGERVRANGTELFVRRLNPGAGEPIVVVHGGPVLEHGYLVRWLEPLSESHELVFYDQRLSGRSAGTVPEESVRVATFVEDIESLRTTLDLGPIHLLAHSWGGHLALRYALDHGDALRSLVLLDPMAASTELWQREEATLAERLDDEERAEMQRLRSSDGVQAGEPSAIRDLLVASFRAQFHDPAAADRLEVYVPDDYRSRSRQFSAMTVDLADFDLHPRLGDIAMPTLLVYGADEPGLELGGRALHDGIPGARLVVIEEAGHFPFVERPSAFLDTVRGFYASLADR